MQARRPLPARAGRKAFASGEKKQNTAETTTTGDRCRRPPRSGAARPGRMHDRTAMRTEGTEGTEGTAGQLRLYPKE
ncbi:hypothetical protein ACWF95_36240 [Streptomyces vinaceus]